MTAIAILQRMAKVDAVADFCAQRFDGARSAWIRRGDAFDDVTDWPHYMAEYESNMQRLCARDREQQAEIERDRDADQWWRLHALARSGRSRGAA